MSIVRCEFCDKNIDTDFNLEHFDEQGVCLLELEANPLKEALKTMVQTQTEGIDHPHELIEIAKRYHALVKVAKALLHLHICEQEGLASGQPTPKEWLQAVDNLSELLYPEK